MYAPFRRRIRLPQLALLALFGLGLVLQPVLAAFGEAHEQAAHAGSDGSAVHEEDGHGNAPYGHADGLSGIASEEKRDTNGEEGRTLHQLLHFAHCCAQSPALRAPELAALPLAPASMLVPLHHAAPLPGRSPNAPYRPPIRA